MLTKIPARFPFLKVRGQRGGHTQHGPGLIWAFHKSVEQNIHRSQIRRMPSARSVHTVKYVDGQICQPSPTSAVHQTSSKAFTHATKSHPLYKGLQMEPSSSRGGCSDLDDSQNDVLVI